MKLFKMMLALGLAITAATALSTQVAPVSDGVYVGMLGSSPIVLKLDKSATDSISATYFYRRIG